MTKSRTDDVSAVTERDATVRCPNCSAPVAGGAWPCPVCGYRPELAREYFWLYLGGAACLLFGVVLGVLGVFVDEVGPEHWSRRYRWFPFSPWPEHYHWLAFLIAGIALSVGGLGLTRHFLSAWVLLMVLTLYEVALTSAAAIGVLGGERRGALVLLAASLLALGLLARVALALWRTPRRDVLQLQQQARLAEDASRAMKATEPPHDDDRSGESGGSR